MDERLKKLKKAMDQNVFNNLEFTEKHQENVQHKIHARSLKLTILSLLEERKSGIEITQILHLRKTKEIVDNEGIIYTLLHEAESDGFVVATWEDGVKRYQLSKLGRKELQLVDEHVRLSIKERLLGVHMHVE